jgi:two-component system response regulator LytT
VKVLVVEDEAVSARRLVRLVQELLGPALTSIAIEPTLDLARARLGTSDLDLVFLDLDLHGDDGFDLVRHAAATFQTVVVSAHPDRAIDAFALGVVDFVAKPFTRERLALALDRVRAGTQRPRRHALAVCRPR